MTTVYYGKYYDVVVLEDGRHAIIKNDRLLMVSVPGTDERQIAVDTAKALDEDRKRKNSFWTLFRTF
jgi:hypothetical protein